jgi:indole-3-glycerol phosphate synthase
MYVKTDTFLDKILAHKALVLHGEVNSALRMRAARDASAAPPPRDFVSALRRDTVALIAEIKKASPSKGVLIEDFDPVAIGTIYAQHGAAAISVLTDEKFFQGHIRYLRDVRAVVDAPLLCKEFIIDSYQVYLARANSADAALLIVAALDDAQLKGLHDLIHSLRMVALVEVHNEAELERALKLGATLIGINNRDLKTFHVDLETTARLAKLVPPDVTLVAESGLNTAEDVRRMGELGAHAVLIGESLMKADNIAVKVRELSSQPRQE